MLGGGGGRRLVWVFSDQNFPPLLPSGSADPCLKIIRMENGDIGTNIRAFLAKHGSAIKSGDLVLISSANQLAREELAGYVRTLLDASNLLRTGGRGCTVLPAPFVLLGGTADPHLIRAIFELHAWVWISGMDPDGVLNDCFAVFEHNIRANQGDRIQPLRMVCKLPMVGTGKKETCVISDGSTNLPIGVGPVTEATELIVTSLLSSIRETFAIAIDTDPWTCRLAAN
jgi:hypothetical protein